jgi:DNA polymerase III subunit beta
MQIKVTQSNLESILNTLIRIISTKPQLPILSCLLLEAKDNQISLFATDLNIGIKTDLYGEVIKEGKVAIPAKIFLETIKSLGKGDLDLSLNDLTLKVKSSKSKTNIQCQQSDDFPDFPTLPKLTSEFETSKLKVIEKYVSFSTSLDQARLILTTLLFRKTEDGLKIVGTDGFRLSVLNLANGSMGDQKEFLIANKAFNEIVKISDLQTQEKVLFEVSSELKQVFFKIGNVELFIRLIEGNYPPFEKIVPNGFEVTGTFDGEEFENVLKQAMVFAREVSNIVTFEFKDSKIKIIANASAKGSYEGEIDVKMIDGSEGKVSFNARYLQDFLKNIKPKRVWFGMNDELKPVMFKEVDNDFYEYVVMPFRLNG